MLVYVVLSALMIQLLAVLLGLSACVVAVRADQGMMHSDEGVAERSETGGRPLWESRAAPVLVADRHPSQVPVARDLTVDPRDAARTELLLHALMASGRVKDW
jgi:hypothetical protein